MGKTAIIVLAAGNSSRLGEPKQLLPYQNKTLLQHILDEAKNAKLDPVICVTGYEAERIAESIADTGTTIVYNKQWPEGMGTGISAGIKQVLNTAVDSVILAVSDQPHVTAELFRTMVANMDESKKGIVACSYAGTLGTPVLFKKKYFNQLIALNGQEGAKHIVKANLSDVTELEFENGQVDIDTKQDYENLISEIK
jgi:molybdenum cofactor cytidylyltransferase